MSEAPDADTFDAEFEEARASEEGDDQSADGGGESEGGEGEGDGDGEGGEQRQAPAEDKVTKRLRQTQGALKAERAERQKLTARLEALERGSGNQEAPLDPVALLAKLREDDEDPIGDIQTVKQLAKLLVGQTDADRRAEAQASQRAQALTTVSTTMKDYEDDFRDLNPDYDKAAKHFMDARAEELKDQGLTGPDLVTAMQNEFAGLVTRSLAAGKDPAEIIYNLAARRGFKHGAASSKLQTIERGQAQARTLSGGGSSQGTLSMAKVAELKGAAFDSAFDKLKASERRR